MTRIEPGFAEGRAAHGRAAGFTLIEVMIVSAVMATILAGTMTVLISMTDTVSSETAQNVLEINSSRTLAAMAEAIVDGCITEPTLPAPGSLPVASWYIKVRRPVDIHVDGTVLDAASGAVELGVELGGTAYDGYWLYSFVKEDDVSGDINGVGGDDTFARGWLVRGWYDVSDAELRPPQKLLRGVLQVDRGGGDFRGDVSGDGVDDPIFQMSSLNELTISVWVYERGKRNRPVLRNVSVRVVPRNQLAGP